MNHPVRFAFVLTWALSILAGGCGDSASGDSANGDSTSEDSTSEDSATDIGAEGKSEDVEEPTHDTTGSDVNTDKADSAVSDVPMDTASPSDTGSQSAVVSMQTSGPACEVAREIQVGVWGNGGACDGEPAFILTVDLSYTCFGWERSLPDGTTRWNSATNFRCYKDRVCYTQHPASGTCEAPIGTTDKEWRAGTCSAGTRVISGTEECPEAPVGGCPLSAKQQGSSDLTCNPL